MTKRDFFKRIEPLYTYFKEFGSLEGIKQNDVYEIDGKVCKIGLLVSNIRMDRKRGLISDTEVKFLSGMGFDWGDTFKKRLKPLLVWHKKHKTLKNLTQYSTMDYEGNPNFNIGEILSSLRREKKEGKFSLEQIEILDKLGIVWAPRDKHVVYSALVKYYQTYGTLRDIKNTDKIAVNGEIFNIGRQINHLRTRYNKGLLDESEINFFDSMGMVWKVKEINHPSL